MDVSMRETKANSNKSIANKSSDNSNKLCLEMDSSESSAGINARELRYMAREMKKIQSKNIESAPMDLSD